MTNLTSFADLDRIMQSSKSGHRSASETPGVPEPTAPEDSSVVSQSTQRNASDGKHTRVPLGKSERTLRRQKAAWNHLQSQGFQTLPDFLKKKAEERDKSDRFEAMVAAVKAKLGALQCAIEKEASETETETKTETETETEDGSEDKDKDNKVVLITESGSTAHQVEQECAVSSHRDLHSDACGESSWPRFEEEESNDDGAVNNPTVDEQSDVEDAQSTVLRMLEDLCRGNDPKDEGHQQSAGNVWNILQDRVALRMAQVELAAMAKAKKFGDFIHNCILAMEAILNIFLDDELGFTWTKASIVVAKTQGNGTTHARTI
ncbi:hypothetical protein EI94DRAFT_1801983 [Lactarius quietus]|nr:hypothetical protein EI94DRAFT_1801983 [Lactarius quietus]